MVIDIIFLMISAWGFYVGFNRGIIKTVFWVLSILIGLLTGFKLAPATTVFLETAFNTTNPLMFLAGFLLTFILSMVIVRVIARLLEGLLKKANVNFINQMAGGALLAGVFVLLYSWVLWFANESTLLSEQERTNSRTYPYLKEFPAEMSRLGIHLQPVFTDFWERTVGMMNKLEEMSKEKVVPENGPKDEAGSESL
ncbi:MAG: CvpA family protein [Saprospiraceae bacterium]|jgi:uncharacterized membrane protein required for colicin V production